jgi:hypothetical protein
MAAHSPKPNGKCTVCTHTERVRLELLLAGGASLRSVARKYGLSHYAVGRHWTGHVSDERKANLVLGPVQRQALAARVAEESSSVIDQLRIVRAGLFQTYDTALTAGDRLSIGMIAGRLHENLRDVARLTGQLATSPLVMQQTNNFFVGDPAFARFQAQLIAALRPFPDARSAVIRQFETLEATPLAAPQVTHDAA